MGKRSSALFSTVKHISLSSMLAVSLVHPVSANGIDESHPWGFRSHTDRANLAGLADVIERKKGGYYDGFTTVVNTTNVTNIGTQVNCNNVADAKANVADNGQSGNAPVQNADGTITSEATGNTSTGEVGAGSGTSNSDNNQTNDGSVGSEVTGSNVSSSNGEIEAGATDNDLDNDQSNAGAVSATLNDSTACNMTNGSFTGNVDAVVDGNTVTGPLN